MAKINNQQEDICPDCKAQLKLGEGVVEGDSFSREVQCLQCDFEGEQVYKVVFTAIIRN